MKSYLVTGAAGFIASRVSTLLLERGDRVVGVDNLNDAYDPRLKHKRLEELRAHPHFDFHELDISDRPGLGKLFESEKQLEGVVNLAARAGVRQSVENPWVYFDTNSTGTLNLLELCHQRNVKKFVLASTSSLYGAHNETPFAEDADTDKPLSPYAASKKSAEALCYTYHYLYNIDVTVLRYFTVYGPAGRPDMSLFRFVQWVSEERPVKIFGDGRQSRDFTYVDDIARGTVAALKPLGYTAINLGSDRPHELIEALRIVEKLVGKKARIEFAPFHRADVRATWASIERARAKLDWEPKTALEEGLAKSVAWYQQNRDWASKIRTE